MASDEFLGEASSRIGSLGSAFYFIPPTVAKGKELGLDGFRFYFLGRGGVLGDVEAPVVGQRVRLLQPRAGGQAVGQRPGAFLAGAAPGGPDLPAVQRRLRPGALQPDRGPGRVQRGGRCGGRGRRSGRTRPLRRLLGRGATDRRAGLAAHLVAVLRELRGSAHLVAIRAVGLDPQVAHYIKRPGDMAAFGWDDNNLPEVTDADRQAHARAEEVTDTLVAPAFCRPRRQGPRGDAQGAAPDGRRGRFLAQPDARPIDRSTTDNDVGRLRRSSNRPGPGGYPRLVSDDSEVEEYLHELALLDEIESVLEGVDAALRRIDDGTFGRCEVCGTTLDPACVVADPLLTACDEHAPPSAECRASCRHAAESSAGEPSPAEWSGVMASPAESSADWRSPAESSAAGPSPTEPAAPPSPPEAAAQPAILRSAPPADSTPGDDWEYPVAERLGSDDLAPVVGPGDRPFGGWTDR